MYPLPHLSQLQINHSPISPSQQYQSHIDHQTSYVPPIAYNSPQSSTKPMIEFPQIDSGLDVPEFTKGDDLIACLNKAMALLTALTSSRFPSTNNQLRTSSNLRNQATIQDGKTEDLDAYDSDYDDVSDAKAVLMANLFNYGSDVISEKAQRIKPTLYDGSAKTSQHAASLMIDDEETLIFKKLKINKDAHEDYLKKTIENTDPICGLVKCARKQNPSETLLDSARKFTKHVQELFTSNKVVPIKDTTSHSVETQKPEIKVYNRRPKQVKYIGSSKEAKIVESKIVNNSKTNHLWGSNATDVSSSSSLVNDRLSRLFSGI
nr:hypothetical protein [Tanacetum cinerariifolium]